MDWMTVSAIAAVATSLTICFHEGIHALTCLVLGGRVKEFSGLHAVCYTKNQQCDKIVYGSASIANIILGLVVLMLLNLGPQLSEIRFFLWIFMFMNLLYGSGYWIFSGIANAGDWANVIAGWKSHEAWRIGMAVFGSFVFMLFVWLSLNELGQIIGGQEPELYKRAQTLALISYITAPLVVVLAGLFFIHGFKSFPVTACLFATFGALSPLLWMMNWFQSNIFVKVVGSPLIIGRNWVIVVAGVGVVMLHAVFLNGRKIFKKKLEPNLDLWQDIWQKNKGTR